MLPFAFSNPFLFPRYLSHDAIGSTPRDSKFPTQLVLQRLPLPPPLSAQTPAFCLPGARMRFRLPLPPPPPASFHPAYVAAAAVLYQQCVDTYRRGLASVFSLPLPLPISDAIAANKEFLSAREIVAIDPNISKTENVSHTLLQARFERLENESKLEDVTIICEKTGNACSDNRDRTDLDDTISFVISLLSVLNLLSWDRCNDHFKMEDNEAHPLIGSALYRLFQSNKLYEVFCLEHTFMGSLHRSF
uniref:Uncharacterized protein n=1 Tax=Romanomermis culicivorax TaxID=13658 RepID=A0A915IQV8_ROMCU